MERLGIGHSSSLSSILLEKFEKDFVRQASVAGIDENNNDVSKDNIEAESNWIDRRLLQEGQAFIHYNFFAIFFAHFISLIFLLCYTPVRYLLLRTGRSNTTAKALKRYVGTLIHIKDWYESGSLHKDFEQTSDIAKIRTLHSRLARNVANRHSTSTNSMDRNANAKSTITLDDQQLQTAIRADFEGDKLTVVRVEEGESKPAISQLDMCVTQFCFMGFLYLFPQCFGIYDMKGLRGYVHIWAVIGKRLGIQDRFNICFERNFYTHELILKRILLPEIGKCESDTLMLWNSLTSGIARFIPFISLKALLVFILKNILKFPEETELKLQSVMKIYDIVCYRLMNRCFNRWIAMWGVRYFLNNLLRLAIASTLYLRFPSLNKNVGSTDKSQSHFVHVV